MRVMGLVLAGAEGTRFGEGNGLILVGAEGTRFGEGNGSARRGCALGVNKGEEGNL